jgi:uncharacterized membrane protein YphA (DoxX/SURF4 family)
MQYLQLHAAQFLILLFIGITFLFSGFEKMLSWKSSLEFYNQHFEATFIKKYLKQLLVFILIGEILCGILAIIAILQILVTGKTTFGFFTCFIAALLLLSMLIGQRIAKDYAGAMNITVYFIVTILGVLMM